jgi:NAD(P)-dependent dehydrogenase (short-subunit alcohol dehydrogenase family)
MSKTALNMAGKLLAEDLAAQDIPVGIVHPGLVSSTQLCLGPQWATAWVLIVLLSKTWVGREVIAPAQS